MKRFVPFCLPLLLAACGAPAPRPVVEPAGAPPSVAVPPAPTSAEKRAVVTKKGGGFYLDDGPLDHAIDLDAIPDAVPKPEPLHRFANRPYAVLGREYVPMTAPAPFRQSGIASWYGRRYHGQKTASGEPYDMFAMTAAHPTLPIPSYARVTRPETGRSVIVRINDRGPFLHGRIIDLSYAAAWKLGLIDNGSGLVLVESVLPGQAAPPADALAPIIAAAEARPAVVDDVEEKGGHYLQLGAFGSRENAEALKARLASTLGELAGKLTVRSNGALHRVQLGPWPDGEAARRVAEELKLAWGLASILVK
ncbi:MAG: septal ring lytic transglycosylase RlpA family protein [Rhodocyclaceae bacterium]|nr:septal ring lytic transglycosylase RlpA family protein [Rhodocyclaceae bacterium]